MTDTAPSSLMTRPLTVAPIARTRWPALMSEEDAAEYVGVSIAQFRHERKEGKWPRPVDRGCRRNTYSRKALDAAIDRLAGLDNAGSDRSEWDC